MRATPHEVRPFSLFFAIPREDEADKCNLVKRYAQVDLKPKVTLPLAKASVAELPSEKFPEIPILVNPKKVPKHTKLLAARDLELGHFEASIQKKRAASLQKEHVESASKSSRKK